MQLKPTHVVLMALTLITIALAACEKLTPTLPNDDQLLDGPVEGLTNAQSSQFLKGDLAFNDQIFTAETG